MVLIKQPYPFDPQDQLDFQFEFQWPVGDTDSVASYTIEVDTGLQVVASNRSGNVITVWVAMAAGITVPDYTELGITCHMVSSNNPPRKLDRTIKLQIRAL